MIDLLLAIVCSSSIALVFKRSESTGANRWAVTATNYAAAGLVSGALLLIRGLPGFEGPTLRERVAEIGDVLGSASRLGADASPVWAVLAGLGAGAVFFGGFILYQLAVRDHGVGLAGAFIKLGILLPATLALLVWRERPTTGQSIGTGLAVVAILLAHGPRSGRAFRPLLLLLFVVGGLAEFSNSVFQRHGLQPDKDIFLFTTFSVALLLSLVALVVSRRPVTRRDLLLGVAVGVPNLFSSWFLIRALEHVEAAVAFPLFGAGTILVLTLAGAFVFRERFRWTEWTAVGVTVLAVVVVSL